MNSDVPTTSFNKAASSFEIIACVDSKYGIARHREIPWDCSADLRYFHRITKCHVCIMGRNTHDEIRNKFGDTLLPKRLCVVISKSTDGISPNASVYRTLNEALSALTGVLRKIFVIGGEQLFAEAIYHPLMERIHITNIPIDFGCDLYFPLDENQLRRCQHLQVESSNALYDISDETIVDNVATKSENSADIIGARVTDNSHECVYNNVDVRVLVLRANWTGESKYLRTLSRIISMPTHTNRTDTSTSTVFGQRLSFKLRARAHALTRYKYPILPIFTTKRVPFMTVLDELLWFISGETNVRALHAHGVKIWDGNTSREYLDRRGLHYYEVGETGPIYGAQWRNWNGVGIDQLRGICDSLRKDPFSRRHVLSAWNPEQLHLMCLPPCHFACVFTVLPDNMGAPKYLCTQVTMRSGDMFLGVPFNVASYALLTHMIACICGLTAKKLVICIADCHVYDNHRSAVETQLTRSARGFPRLVMSDKTRSYKYLDEFQRDDFTIVGYFPHPTIRADMVA